MERNGIENSGYLAISNYWNLNCVITGASVGELSLLDRIDLSLKSLDIFDKELTGNEILGPFLIEIVEGTKDETTHTPRSWIEKLAIKVDSSRGEILSSERYFFLRRSTNTFSMTAIVW